MSDGATTAANCPWCEAPRGLGPNCPKCGAIYAKLEQIKANGRARGETRAPTPETATQPIVRQSSTAQL